MSWVVFGFWGFFVFFGVFFFFFGGGGGLFVFVCGFLWVFCVGFVGFCVCAHIT